MHKCAGRDRLLYVFMYTSGFLYSPLVSQDLQKGMTTFVCVVLLAPTYVCIYIYIERERDRERERERERESKRARERA